MTEVLGEHRPRRKIVWFDVGASVLFLVIGIPLLGRVLWHIIEHHELMPKSLISGVLFCSVAVMFPLQGLKSTRASRRRLRGKISKRNRRIPLFLLLVVLSSLSQAQVGSTEGVRSASCERSKSPCATIP